MKEHSRNTVTLASAMALKWLLFDALWAWQTTFACFSTAEIYLFTALAALTLTLPYALWRCRSVQYALLWMVDGWLIANLMYSRTYFAAIPLESYALAGNLADFTASVKDSLRAVDLLFPLLSVLAMALTWKGVPKAGKPFRKAYLASWLAVAVAAGGLTLAKGGFKRAYESLQNANKHSCGVPMYTLFGHLYYQATQQKATFTPEMRDFLSEWQSRQPAYVVLDSLPERSNLVVILCESLESWVLERTVEGQEITPTLNRLLQDSSTLYAPHVLTQVAGGRSIDGQLLLNAGLLPVEHGTYSTQYPTHTYYTLTKALAEKHHSRSYLMTVDKAIVWNQGMVARAFGIDSLLDKPCWVNDEKVGSRKKLGDDSFFRQAVEKLQTTDLWPVGEPVYLQCVTYSGHNPFVLPDHLKRIHFEDDYPQRMKDYMCMANYTDHALGQLISYLQSRPDYDRTLVVITGDHEGLASDREALCASAGGHGIVSDRKFTPFIVLNSPVGLRYEPVMGQIDMYPTLLNLLSLDDYPWKGLGQSILSPAKPALAIDAQHHWEGDPAGVSEATRRHLEEAWRASDLMIRFDCVNNRKAPDHE
jgi:phosphoglycerol transferase MdoB-like AlkP superfamily enzyme